MGREYRPKVIAEGLNVAIVAGQFNESITAQLVDGALDMLQRSSTEESNADIFWVPGSFELPMLTSRLVSLRKYDGILTIGALIKGSTDHYDVLASSVTSSLASIAAQGTVPISFCVLTCETIEQAMERAGTKLGNKGSETMSALIQMINLYRAVESENG